MVKKNLSFGNEESVKFLESSEAPKDPPNDVEVTQEVVGPSKAGLSSKNLKIPFTDWVLYKFGILIITYPASRFLLLLGLSVGATIVLGNLYAHVVDPDGDNRESKHPPTAMYLAFQVNSPLLTHSGLL